MAMEPKDLVEALPIFHAGNRDVEQLGGVNHWHSDLDNVASWLECRQASTAGHAQNGRGWLADASVRNVPLDMMSKVAATAPVNLMF
jgi:hypothetical protein